MRTTLAIDDNVLAIARRIAERQHKSVGEVISELARQALRPTVKTGSRRNGVPLLPARPGTTPVTPELINRLRNEFP
jgi:hypothetical protein